MQYLILNDKTMLDFNEGFWEKKVFTDFFLGLSITVWCLEKCVTFLITLVNKIKWSEINYISHLLMKR